MKNQDIVHIERDSLHTCRVEILNSEGEFKSHIGHTTINNLRKAGYTVDLKTEAQIVETSLPHITDESFKLGLKVNFERLSKSDEKEKRAERQKANERYLEKQLAGMSLGDVLDKLGVV